MRYHTLFSQLDVHVSLTDIVLRKFDILRQIHIHITVSNQSTKIVPGIYFLSVSKGLKRPVRVGRRPEELGYTHSTRNSWNLRGRANRRGYRAIHQ